MKISNLTELTNATDRMEMVINDNNPITKKIKIENLKNSLGLPISFLYGFITQSETNAPTIVITHNNLNIVPTFTYNSVGDYTMNFATSVLNDNTLVMLGTSGNYPYTLQATFTNNSEIALKSFRDNVKYDGGFSSNIPIKIEVYA